MYEEILELNEYCKFIGLHTDINSMSNGYIIRFANGSDIVQHDYSYGSANGMLEPAIGCDKDYTPVTLEEAKELVRNLDVQHEEERMATIKDIALILEDYGKCFGIACIDCEFCNQINCTKLFEAAALYEEGYRRVEQ